MLGGSCSETPLLRSAFGILLGTLVTALLTGMAYAVVLHGAPAVGLPAVLVAMLLLMRGLAAIAGGYVAAAVARRRPAAHGFAVGVAYLLASQLVPGVVALFTQLPAVQALWQTAGAMGVTLVGSALGGGARGQTRR